MTSKPQDNIISATSMDVLLGVVSQNTEAITELSRTMTDVRVSIRGLQSEVENQGKSSEKQSSLIEQLAHSIEEMKSLGKDIQELRGQFNIHENSGIESRKRMNERIDEQNRKISEVEKIAESAKNSAKMADDKSKIDLVKIGVQLFLYVFGGGGGIAFFVWLFENHINKP